MPTLDWIGKDKVVNHHLEVPYHVLDKQYTFGADESENMIIHGDNLVALKALLPKYEGKIKCIYIDPPYNTGNEAWVYNDRVNDPTILKWLHEVVGKEGDDLTRHDKWLCMMYPRLKLLHRLLSKDGAIFISIDYHEQSSLKLLCDEIFGSNNYIAEIACVNSPKGRDKNKAADIATAHECITIYRKTSAFHMGGFEPEDKITKRYNAIEGDTGRRFRLIDLRKTGNSDERVDRPNLFYPFFFNEATGDLIVGSNDMRTPEGYIRIVPMKSPEIEGRWCWERDTAEEGLNKLVAQYQVVKKQWSIFQKDYLDERDSVIPTTAWTFKDVNSERGTELFQKKLGFKKNDFPNPKPVGTIERIISISTEQDDIVLDSFAGSGTTAHAVLNLNKSTGSNRKFILVELMDYAEQITAERVRRAITDLPYNKEEVIFDQKIDIKNLAFGDDILSEARSIASDEEYTGVYSEISKPFMNDEGHLIVTGLRKSKTTNKGTGGSFSFYELGAPIILNDKINPDVPIETVKEFIYYLETKQAYKKDSEEKALLGVNSGCAYYFFYTPGKTVTLNRRKLSCIKTNAESYVIYADNCTLSDEELKKYNITFKKPGDIGRF